MSALSAGQRARLGAFLLVGGAGLVITLIAMVGVAAFAERDAYIVRFGGSVGSLSVGAAVRYNGIGVGRVESLRIEPQDVTTVRVDLSLTAGTPIKADAVAVLEMAGITGLRYIELTGGSNTAALLPPGSEITASDSTLGTLTAQATSIARKIERLVDNLATMTDGVGGTRVPAILERVEAATTSLTALLSSGEALVTDLRGAVAGAQLMFDEVGRTATLVRTGLEPDKVTRIADALAGAADAARRRLSREELGGVIAAVERLASRSGEAVARADLSLIQVKDDLLRALDALIIGVEAFGDFASLLRDDPSALIRGRGDSEREIP